MWSSHHRNLRYSKHSLLFTWKRFSLFIVCLVLCCLYVLSTNVHSLNDGIPKDCFAFDDRLISTLCQCLQRAGGGNATTYHIPIYGVLLMNDADEFILQFESMGKTPAISVGIFVFIWNGNNTKVEQILNQIQSVFSQDYVVVHHDPSNAGFAGSVNTIFRVPVQQPPRPPTNALVVWYFITNADVRFPKDSLPCFVRGVNQRLSGSGGGVFHTSYGIKQYFAFAVTATVLEKVGLFDENYYPAYMEDVDFRWRLNLAGVESITIPSQECQTAFVHAGSVNLHHDGNNNNLQQMVYKSQLFRSRHGWEYARLKWGYLKSGNLLDQYPPSGYKTPFNITALTIRDWAFDPSYRLCIQYGLGIFQVGKRGKGTCWYNAQVLREKYKCDVFESLLAKDASYGDPFEVPYYGMYDDVVVDQTGHDVASASRSMKYHKLEGALIQVVIVLFIVVVILIGIASRQSKLMTRTNMNITKVL